VYVPKAYSVDDLDTLHEFIHQNSFGILISVDGDKPVATHLPLLLDTERNLIEGHLAKPNPHCALLDGRPATCIFAGPHAYVSSLWYESQPNVPTWNYTAVHVHGRAQAIADPVRIREILRKTIETYDPKLHATPQTEREEAYYVKQEKGIIAFQIAIESIQGKFKLNQNKTEQDQRNVIAELANSPIATEREVAAIMKP
jgi:transcriptional regulator